MLPSVRSARVAVLTALCAMLTPCLSAQTAAQPTALELPLSEFVARRVAMAQKIDSGVVLAFGARTPVHDFSAFFQLPAFRYLTNYLEPDAAFVMVVRGGVGTSTLYLAPIEPRSAFYYGERADSTQTEARYGLRGRSFDALAGDLDTLIRSGMPIYHIPDVETTDFARLDSLTRGQQAVKRLQAAHPSVAIRNAMPQVLQLRAKRSDAELALIKRAVAITSEGHVAAMRTANPQHEYELKAALEFEFTRRGAERPAYGSIVGGGRNTGTLHYMRDSDPVKPGDLVLMDAGAEFRGYAADVTRTIPVSGTYTKEQRDIYQLVLDSQLAAERNSKPGMNMRAATDSSVAVRSRGLAELGLIESEDALYDPPWAANCVANPASCRQSNLWMIHGISHGIGLAVHDPLQGSFSDGTFQQGDAFTIEPGVYISTRSLDVLPDTPRNRRFIAAVRDKVQQYEHTGVRIEDCYIITANGLERISLAPREMDEIEAIMRQQVRFQP